MAKVKTDGGLIIFDIVSLNFAFNWLIFYYIGLQSLWRLGYVKITTVSVRFCGEPSFILTKGAVCLQSGNILVHAPPT